MIKSCQKYCVLLVIIFEFFTGSSFAMRGEDEAWSYYQYIDLPLVYLTTKRAEKTSESALNIRIITRDEIEIYGFQTLRDLFGYMTNSIVAFKGVDQVYGLRGVIGYANDKIKFLIDGLEFPMELGLGEGDFPVTLDEVKRIEIVKGPNTSIFGGNATQATINVIRYNGSDFQGLRVGAAVGNFDHRRGWLHYAEQPQEDFNYDIYFNTSYSEGYDHDHHFWWHGGTTEAPAFGDVFSSEWESQDRNTPLPDHELIASANYQDFRLVYRRVEQGVFRFTKYMRNYTDAMALEAKASEFLGQDNLDFIFTLEASAFGQQYDYYHNPFPVVPDAEIDGLEHKAEKRLEWDAQFHYQPDEEWDLLAGVGGNYWRAESTEWGGFLRNPGDFPVFVYAPDIESGIVSDEYFPSFTEVNDLANMELWADWKYTGIEDFSFVFGGRYVYDFVPDDQLRDSKSPSSLYRTDRELLRKFFPKAAVVWKADEDKNLKLIYQEGFNRPNSFEQFSMQNNTANRGRIEATEAQTFEFVANWIINENLKAQAAIFHTQLENFTNFAYTGSSFPVVEEGELIGFNNVGDQEIQGIELNLDLHFERLGGVFNFGYLAQNEIEPFPAFFPNGPGGTGATGIIDTSDFNRQTIPEWTLSTGLWVRLMEKTTLSLLYKVQGDIKNNFNRENYELPISNKTITIVDIDRLDATLNIKNFFNENLNLQLLAQNLFDEDTLIGEALNPVHAHGIKPAYYQVKVSYLWD